jgi:hypothetical protein
MKTDTKEFYKELSSYLNFHLNCTILMTTLHADPHTFLRVSLVKGYEIT